MTSYRYQLDVYGGIKKVPLSKVLFLFIRDLPDLLSKQIYNRESYFTGIQRYCKKLHFKVSVQKCKSN